MSDDKQIENLDALTDPAVGDVIPIVDDPTGSPVTKKITPSNFLKVINGLTSETAPASDDELLLFDTSASAADKITISNFFKTVDGMDALASADTADALLLYDSSASAAKKITKGNLITGGGQSRKSLPVTGAYLPDDSASNAAAQIQSRTSSGGNLHPAWKEALFDDSTDEHIFFKFTMPDNYSGSPIGDIWYKCTSATSGSACFAVAICAVSDGDATDVDADTFDTANTGTVTVPGTAGYEAVCSITMTNADSVAASDDVILVVFRDVSGDSVTGDIEVRQCELRYTST